MSVAEIKAELPKLTPPELVEVELALQQLKQATPPTAAEMAGYPAPQGKARAGRIRRGHRTEEAAASAERGALARRGD
jgi:hypothetical protein